MTAINWIYLPRQMPNGITHDDAVVIIARAAGEWNNAMQGLVSFQHGTGSLQATLFFGNSIDQNKHPGRIAECRDNHGSWEIEFDVRSKWNKGEWWKRIIGIGNNLMSAAMHEFGHVMDLPHATNAAYVMHSELPDANKMSKIEASEYRKFFVQREKNNI